MTALLVNASHHTDAAITTASLGHPSALPPIINPARYQLTVKHALQLPVKSPITQKRIRALARMRFITSICQYHKRLPTVITGKTTFHLEL